MDATKKLICRVLGADSDYKSALNSQKKCKLPFRPVIDDDDGTVVISFLPVQKQLGTYNSDPFVIAFAAGVLDAKLPIDVVFDV